jgi:hypothetical protein
MPIVLSKNLRDVILLVHLQRSTFLRKSTYVAEQEIRKGVAARHGARVGKRQDAIHTGAGLRNFVFVRIHEVGAKLDVVRPNDLGDVVAEGKCWIRIQRALRYVTWIFREAAAELVSTADANAWDLSAVSIVVKAQRRWDGAALPRPG